MRNCAQISVEKLVFVRYITYTHLYKGDNK
jgi:hypothetical protein